MLPKVLGLEGMGTLHHQKMMAIILLTLLVISMEHTVSYKA
jgi:hypothetical protein